MLKVNVADYIIHNLAGMNIDNDEAVVAQTIDMLVDSWSDNQYLVAHPNIEYRTKVESITFGNRSLRSISCC